MRWPLLTAYLPMTTVSRITVLLKPGAVGHRRSVSFSTRPT